MIWWPISPSRDWAPASASVATAKRIVAGPFMSMSFPYPQENHKLRKKIHPKITSTTRKIHRTTKNRLLHHDPTADYMERIE